MTSLHANFEDYNKCDVLGPRVGDFIFERIRTLGFNGVLED